jgi:hypothetical protein
MSLSKWERTRQHLNGELKKINCSECHEGKSVKSVDAYFKELRTGRSNPRFVGEFVVVEPSATILSRYELTERLIDLLAENGHHIRDLPPKQYVTLSVTFREPLSVPQATPVMSGMMAGTSSGSSKSMSAMMPSPMLPGGPGMMGISNMRGDSGRNLGGKSSSRNQAQKSKSVQKGKMSPPAGPGGGPGGPGPGGPRPTVGWWSGFAGGGYGQVSGLFIGNEELAGDLHMRQENFKKAAQEYEKALKKWSSATETIYSSFGISLSKELNPNIRRLLHSLAVAQLRGGDLTKAKVLLDKLAAIEKSMQSSRPKQPEQASVSLPARLVISVTKAHLDAVAAGKMSQEEFRKQVSVDYFDPASVKPKKDDNNSTKP